MIKLSKPAATQAKDKKYNRKKKEGMKGKKIHNLALTHIMHAPHKACNFRFTKSKEREKNQSKGE